MEWQDPKFGVITKYIQTSLAILRAGGIALITAAEVGIR